MTWNVLHGGGPRRLPEIALALLDLAPDLLLLTEFRPGRGGQLAGVLADHGWAHQVVASRSATTNGLLLASRHEVRAVAQPAAPAGLEARWLEAHCPSWSLTVGGCHIPHRGSGSTRTALWKHAVERARAHRHRPFVLLGDLNSGRNGIDGPDRAFDCTQRLGELAALRFTDAWRSTHPASREGTWTGSHAGGSPEPHRIDHAHLSEPLSGSVKAAWHEQGLARSGLSDHAALMVTLELPSEAA